MRTEFSYEATKLEEDLVRAPAFILPGMVTYRPGSYVLPASAALPPPPVIEVAIGDSKVRFISTGMKVYDLSQARLGKVGGSSSRSVSRGLSGSLVALAGSSRIFFNDEDGFGFDAYQTMAWLGGDADGIWIDVEASGGRAYGDADGIGFEVIQEFFGDEDGIGFDDAQTTGYMGGDADGIWIDPEESGGRLGGDADGIWLDIQ